MSDREWQPIATAPKEDAEILTWCEGVGTVVCVWWEDQGWVDAQEYLRRDPSHWMPLPPAPSRQKEDA